ncbi:MAG: hypothetical protein RIS47_987 [Bacteroidota bacterium]|jgi:hypothetical protein
MENYFLKTKNYLIELEHSIVYEDEIDGVMIIENEEMGLKNVFLAVADPILIMEALLLEVKVPTVEMFAELLKKNRDIVHGAFALDESGTKVIFRDTLQIEHLDLNEIEASLNSLSLLLSEYSDELISLSKC